MGAIHFPLRDIHHIGRLTRELLIHPEDCPVLRRHQITLAGISYATTGFRFVRHHPGVGQLIVCFRGKGRVWVDGKWKTCSAGTAYLTPHDQFHAYESGPRWEIGWITYRPMAFVPTVSTPKLIETDPRPLEHILRGFHHEISSDREAILLESWSLLLIHHAGRIVFPDHSSRLWRLWQTVQADLAAEWNLERLAHQAALGPENLRRICLRETGCSPMQHLTRLRMQYAASLLTTSRKIQEVANLAGYTNAFAFSTAFKRVMKQSPSRFRE
jgi:AraC-like DNA-binding protein